MNKLTKEDLIAIISPAAIPLDTLILGSSIMMENHKRFVETSTRVDKEFDKYKVEKEASC